ncbi:MAG: hypothetical protein HY744_17295 [Deltaproteobacteria bacterium]|nr:hypothetical protein [Deltaproteobacteria bacterium]
MPHPLLEDPFVAAQLEAAIAPYRGKLPLADLEWMREQLALLLDEDPAARAALAGAYPRQVDESGERVRPGKREPVARAGRERKRRAG